jgi:hypothetical protein
VQNVENISTNEKGETEDWRERGEIYKDEMDRTYIK